MEPIDSNKLREIISIHMRRLQALKKQQALKGSSTPPEILIEIEDIRAEVAHLSQQLAALPNYDLDAFRRLRVQAREAFFRQEWEKAVRLATQALAINPGDEDLRDIIAKSQQQLQAQEDYAMIRQWRDAGEWQLVWTALDDLARKYPQYPDPEGLRVWAEKQKLCATYSAIAHTAQIQSDWTTAIAAINALLAISPADNNARSLLSVLITLQEQTVAAWHNSKAEITRKLKDIEVLLPAHELKKRYEDIMPGDYMPAILLSDEEQKRVGAYLGALYGYHRIKKRIEELRYIQPESTAEYRQDIEVFREIIVKLNEIYSKLRR